MSAHPVGVGVVGCGVIGSRRAAIAARTPGSRVVAVSDRDWSRAAEVAANTGAVAWPGWESIVEHSDVDVVVAATTHDWLAPVSIRALRAGSTFSAKSR